MKKEAKVPLLQTDDPSALTQPVVTSKRSEEEEDKPVPFPPIVEMPALWQVLATLLLCLGVVLSVTVFRNQLEDCCGVTPKIILQYGSIPVVSVLFTYAHIWLALWMTFYPLRFVGCLQIPGTNVGLGWQGIVPHKAEEMARKAVRLMTQELLDVKEIFSRLDPVQVAAELEPMLYGMLDRLMNEVAKKHSPTVWELMPQRVKQELVSKAAAEAPECIARMMEEVRSNITQCFDLEWMVVENLKRNTELLCQIFIRCGYKELVFIRNSGIYMGLLFGVLQMICWVFYRAWWILPAVGGVVGTLTNWIALKMIFSPVEPVPICCGWKLHGLFLQRQDEVAAVYGRVIARQVLNGKAIAQAFLNGPTTDRLFGIIQTHVQRACDDFAGPSRKLLALTVGDEAYRKMKEDVVRGALEMTPEALYRLEGDADAALDLENTLREKLQMISSRQFEQLLHPVFEQDEWKLVILGGVLGVAVGILQAFALQQ